MPTFAQVVICYNQRRELRRALESVLGQSVRPDRVIVGDDASTDGSRAVVREYVGKYPDLIRPVLADRNGGIAANLNRCIEAAAAEYLSFLAADDWLLPGKYERQFECVREGHSEYRFFYSGHRLERDAESRDDEVVRVRCDGDCFANLARRRLPARNYWVHRPLVEEVGGFDESLPLYEDWKMKLEVALRTPWRYCPGVYSVYSVHEGGVHTRDIDLHLRTIRRIEEDLVERYDLSPRRRRYLRATRSFFRAKASRSWPERIRAAVVAAALDPGRWLPRFVRWAARKVLPPGESGS